MFSKTILGGYSLSDSQNATLTPMHLRKAKLMFFWVRYPSSAILKMYFPDIKFNKNNTAQLVKWFSNFRSVNDNQLNIQWYDSYEKYATGPFFNIYLWKKPPLPLHHPHAGKLKFTFFSCLLVVSKIFKNVKQTHGMVCCGAYDRRADAIRAVFSSSLHMSLSDNWDFPALCAFFLPTFTGFIFSCARNQYQRKSRNRRRKDDRSAKF